MIKNLLLILLFLVSGLFYYSITGNSTLEVQNAVVQRVIDGDTLVLEDQRKVRLKGINTPEKSTIYFEEAKNFLKNYL